jgi:hypothetical protein
MFASCKKTRPAIPAARRADCGYAAAVVLKTIIVLRTIKSFVPSHGQESRFAGRRAASK